jgi:hypothetical protein
LLDVYFNYTKDVDKMKTPQLSRKEKNNSQQKGSGGNCGNSLPVQVAPADTQLSRKEKKRRLTFEQEMQLRYFYREKSKRNEKRIKWFMDELLEAIKYIGKFFIVLLSWLVSIFISVMVGYASEPIVYALNKPLGLGYAHFASYALAVLTMVLLKDNYSRGVK